MECLCKGVTRFGIFEARSQKCSSASRQLRMNADILACMERQEEASFRQRQAVAPEKRAHAFLANDGDGRSGSSF